MRLQISSSLAPICLPQSGTQNLVSRYVLGPGVLRRRMLLQPDQTGDVNSFSSIGSGQRFLSNLAFFHFWLWLDETRERVLYFARNVAVRTRPFPELEK